MTTPTPPTEPAGALVDPSDRALRRMFETLSMPLMLVGPDGTIRWAGGTVERDFGYQPEELVGRNVVEFIPPDQIETAVASLADLGQSEEVGIGVPTAFAVVRPDGSFTWQAVGAVPLLDEPEVEGFTFFFLPWDAHHHFDRFMAALLVAKPLGIVLGHLGRSIAASTEALAATIHHGFDGTSFRAVDGVTVPAACLDVVDPPWTRVAVTGETEHLSVEDLGPEAAASARAVGIEGLWVIAVPPAEGIETAVMTIWRGSPNPPVTAHDFVITRSLSYVELALVRHTEHQRLAHIASHDHLTGVATRAVFGRHLAGAVEGAASAVVLYCDLDGFKDVNDTYGHIAGDEVLVEIARRFRTALRPGDLLARMGGDEFTVLLRGDVDAARAVAGRIVESLAEPIELVQGSVTVAVSVGAAVAEPGSTPDSVLRRADAALYAAKAEGGAIRVAGHD